MFNNGDTGTPQRAVLYARVSTDEQKEGDNILTQIRMGEQYCKTFGIELTTIYDQDEGISGTLPLQERPGGAMLLEAARDKKFDVVLIYNVKRLSRKLTVLLDAWSEFEALGLNVRSMTESIDTSSPMGRMVMQMLGVFAELDRETILEQTRDGKETIIRRGYWPGGNPPFGYSIHHERGASKGSRRGQLVINEDEAGLVRQIFSMYVDDRLYLMKIAEHLNQTNTPTLAMMRSSKVTGKRWRVGNVHSIITNPVYCGKPVYYRKHNTQGREQIEGTAPAIISDEVWLATQALLSANTKMSKRNRKHTYLLHGLVKCGLCGLSCVGQSHSSRGQWYYRCHDRSKVCPGINVRGDKLDTRIWDDIKEYVYNPGETAQLVAQEIDQEQDNTQAVLSDIAKIDQTIQEAGKQRSWVIDQGKRGLISNEEAEQALMETKVEIEMLNARKRELEGQIAYHDSRQDYVTQIEAMLSDLRESVNNADETTKEWATQLMVEKVVVTPIDDTHLQVEPYYRFTRLQESSIGSSAPLCS